MAANKKPTKPVAKKPAPKKGVAKSKAKPPAKKPVITKKTVAKSVKKPLAKKAPLKPVAKKKVAPKKVAKPIKKIVPAKKTAKPVVKKAAPKKLPTPLKKTKPAKKTAAPIVVKHKPAVTQTKPSPQKPVAKTQPLAKKAESKIPDVKVLPKAKNIKVSAPKPLVLPKITATKARKYEPEFTRSVLDQAPQEHTGPTQRYSDGELNEFRELIQRKLETAKKELGYLQGLITRKDEMGGDDTDNRYMTMEDGSLSMEREQLSQMASRQITFIDHLEKAMMRIENKTYGICRVTGKLIDKARLRAVPHATLSIEAKMGQVR
jgi:RNA polymerase-binding transcription factor DksA